jgi:hypothetical protein
MVPMIARAPEEQRADRRQIGKHERLHDRRIDIAEDIGAENAADDAGDRQPSKQLPVHVLVQNVADARGAGGEGFHRMHAGRRGGRRHPEADQQGTGNHPKRHAERAVDQLRSETCEDERQHLVNECRIHERMAPRPCATMRTERRSLCIKL